MWISRQKLKDRLIEEFDKGYRRGYDKGVAEEKWRALEAQVSKKQPPPPPETSTYRVKVKQDEWYEHGNVAYVRHPNPVSVSLHAPGGDLIAHYSYFGVVERVLDE